MPGLDQEEGAVHGVQQRRGVVDGQAFLTQAVAQPVQELLAGRVDGAFEINRP